MSGLQLSPLEDIIQPKYGRKWRELPWSHWEHIVKKPTIAYLRALCERYNQSFALMFPATLIKQSMVELAMQTIDLYQPPLDDEQVKKAFGFVASANTAELLEQNPAFNVIQSPPDKLVTPDQLQTIIRRFLQDVRRQSWRIAPDCVPYLPAQPLDGGRTISLESSLHGLPGPVSWLQAETRLNGSGETKYEFSQSGQFFPCRGRGPKWQNNSCALDCAIVAARLLNLGRTVADRDSSSALPGLTTHFMDLIKLPWEDLDDSTSYEYRAKFFAMFLEKFNANIGTNQTKTRIGDLMPVIAVWNYSTLGINQLSFTTQVSSTCSKCFLQTTDSVASLNQCIYLDQINDTTREAIGEKPTMGELLNLYFGKRKQRKACAVCKSRETRTFRRSVKGNLPQRLVVLPEQSYRDVHLATKKSEHSIFIRYSDTTNTPRDATYRWLGGIYKSGVHYRLYWTDHGKWHDYGGNEHNPKTTNDILVYDGMELGGSIIGGVVPYNPDAKVPQVWTEGTDILFYERVEPSATALQSTPEAIKLEAVRVVSELLQPSQSAQGIPTQSVPSNESLQQEMPRRKPKASKDAIKKKFDKKTANKKSL